MMKEYKYKTGLVLSGGGARGFAHLGVIQALNDAGIFPEVISGTSAGAIAGAFYCDGYKPKDILKIMKTDSRLNYMRPVLPRYGLLQISGIAKILNSHLRASTFEELKIPFYVAATNLNKGRIEYFSEGELLYPVIASSSIPVLFKPVVINKYSYVDGGVMDNLPIKPIENLCRFFIGSFVNPLGDQEEFSSLIDIAARTFILNLYKEALEKSKMFDLFIAPNELRNYNILDPEKAEDLFNIGYEATNNLLEKTGFLKILFPPVEKDNK
jgi:NTE family protein